MRLPERADVVIIGGGIAGTSLAYFLTRLGRTDVLLLEQSELGSGTTFYSAGVVGQLRSTEAFTRLMTDAVLIYSDLQRETGIDPGWHPVGSLRLASSQARLEELQRQVALARRAGLQAELLSAEEAQGCFPPISSRDITGAAFLPGDGWIEPANLTLAYARGARQRGATIATEARVTAIERRDGHIAGIHTNVGSVQTETVVNAAGLWAVDVARMVGVSLPAVNLEHQYLLTAPIGGVSAELPVLRDPDNLIYVRPEARGLLVGGWEQRPVPWALDGIPEGFNAKVLAPDWLRFEEILPGAYRRLPGLADAGVVQLLNGVDAYTPDGQYLLGPTQVPGFWVAAAFCSQGVSLSGVNGRLLAEWIVTSEPPIDLWPTDPRRFGPQFRSRSYSVSQTLEVVGNYFSLRYPHQERENGRPLRRSPMHERLAALGCAFGEKVGWERPNWFESNAPSGDEGLRPRGIASVNWSPAIGAEARAVRQTAGLIDISSFSKVEVSGAGAAAFLQRVCANDVDRQVGTIVYTQACNRRGGIECDLTVTRLERDRFLLVTGATYGRHTLAWLEDQVTPIDKIEIRDLSGSLAAIGLWGPEARTILSAVVEEDVANVAFPYGTVRELHAKGVTTLALRITNVGECGWELYVSPEYAATLWDAIWESGIQHGMRACGYRSIDSLRLEKAYRVRGLDLTPSDDPFQAGLGFAVALEKAMPFVGRDALVAAGQRGPDRRLRCIQLQGADWLPLGGEAVLVDGVDSGWVTSAGYGYAVESGIAMAYVATPRASIGTPVEIDIGSQNLRGVIVKAPLYDPENLRVRS